MAAIAIPHAVADSDVDQVVDFYATLPAPMFEQLAPEYLKEGDGASVNASGGFAGAELGVPLEGVEVTFRPLPPPEFVVPRITGVTFDGPPVVEFEVLNDFGFGVDGFVQEENVEFEFTVSKLIPRGDGLPPAWQNYFLFDDEGVEDAQAGAVVDGTVEALGDGNYRFTFGQELEAFSGILFEPELTHRVGMEIRDPVLNGEEIEGMDTAFDIVPATGQTEGIVSRNIVTQEACAACHGTEDFAFHGGPRQDVTQCVACHQQGSFDAGSGNSIEFGVMIHKIHQGANLNNLPLQYCGFGCENFGAPPDDFSEVHFPQSTQNCVACHDPANEATPQAINIANAPTAEMCASCHDNLAFDENGLTNANRKHLGLAQPNSTCAACHSENGLMVSSLEEHDNLSVLEAQKFNATILAVTNSGEGQSPAVTFTVVDPTNDNAPYDLAADPAFTGSGVRYAMGFSWPNTDFSNVGNDAGTTSSGRPAGQAYNIAIATVGPGLPDYVMDNGDGTYTLDTALLPEPVVVPTTTPSLGSGTVVIEGHPAADLNFDGVYDEEVPATSVSRAFAITDAQADARREVVDVGLCQDCHGKNDGLALHGGNRVDNVEVCTSCHTPNATDLFRRPADPDAVANTVNEAAFDGREDRVIDMKYMVHAIHAAGMREEPYVVYGFGGSVHDYSDVAYPRSVADCEACHADDDSYVLPLSEGVLASTTESGATVTASGFFGAQAYAPGIEAALDPTDDNNVSPEASACVACHDSSGAKQHMAARGTAGFSFGNAFLLNPDPIGDPDTQDDVDANPQNCTFCHGANGFVQGHAGN
ncbi:MAG: OmcA/MtrC family decaheme c-type cytochrome [Wenzhouxiangellaceae bacterium]|nr:OmcA/MtrC family decaheme c-type cytochrome [Wenzhouxiangellaceae bacterium]